MNDLLKIAKSLQDNNIKEADAVVYYTETLDFISKSDLEEENILETLRNRRYDECFNIVNRGVLWYNTLTEEQRLELDKWYKEWLDITDTYKNTYEQNPEIDIETIIPIKPTWLK